MLLAVAFCAAGMAGCARDLRTLGRSEHFVLQGACAETDAEDVLDAAEFTLAAVTTMIDLAPPSEPAAIMLFPTGRARRSYLSSACPRLSHAAAATVEKDGGFTIVLSERWRDEETLQFLRHEVVHFVLVNNSRVVPVWLDEGMAQIFEIEKPLDRVHPELSARLAHALGGDDRPMLSSLVSVPRDRGLTRAQYPQAWGLVWHLMTQSDDGPERLRRCLLEHNPLADPEEEFERFFGASPAAIEAVWRERMTALGRERK